MLTQDRYQQIVDIINERNTVTVAELSKQLHISESTVRRDLTALDNLGRIRKFFGGATAVNVSEGAHEDAVSVREMIMSEEKAMIGQYSAQLISDNDFVFIDSGTTTLKLVDCIENKNATYITNGITHARRLIQRGFSAYIIGGRIKAVTEAIVGAEAVTNLSGFNFSKAFMGTNGIDLNAGFSTPDVEEAMIKQAAIDHCSTAFVLADHTKFRRIFPVSFSKLDRCCIITDEIPDNRFRSNSIIKEVKK